MRTTGWLRSVGLVKLELSFVEYSLFIGLFCKKRPIILSILLTEATPYLDLPQTSCIYVKTKVVHRYSDVKYLDAWSQVPQTSYIYVETKVAHRYSDVQYPDVWSQVPQTSYRDVTHKSRLDIAM